MDDLAQRAVHGAGDDVGVERTVGHGLRLVPDAAQVRDRHGEPAGDRPHLDRTALLDVDELAVAHRARLLGQPAERQRDPAAQQQGGAERAEDDDRAGPDEQPQRRLGPVHGADGELPGVPRALHDGADRGVAGGVRGGELDEALQGRVADLTGPLVEGLSTARPRAPSWPCASRPPVAAIPG